MGTLAVNPPARSGPDTPASPRLADHEIFPSADYQHRLRLGRCAPSDYFGPWEPHSDLLAERGRWIDQHPDRHVVADGSSIAALVELAEWAETWTGRPVPRPSPLEPKTLVAELGTRLEPDFVLLSRDSQPARMTAGCVCFPSSWYPEHKLGATLEGIHDVVPGLNPTLGEAIDGFLSRLKPGTAWIRANWGLSASSERNQHPWRRLQRLHAPFNPSATWVRIEHQALLVLPRSGAILFGIRIEHRPLSAVGASASTAVALARALRSMPEPMAAYKGIAEVRGAAADYLAGGPSLPSM